MNKLIERLGAIYNATGEDTFLDAITALEAADALAEALSFSAGNGSISPQEYQALTAYLTAIGEKP